MKEMLLIHASGGPVRFPEIRRSVYTKDFSCGFYCTTNKNQAERWARRNETPTLNYYSYTENPKLKILKFDEITEEWLDFIAKCRNGEIHDYDIVEGPMADDKIWLSVSDFLDGLISREAF